MEPGTLDITEEALETRRAIEGAAAGNLHGFFRHARHRASNKRAGDHDPVCGLRSWLFTGLGRLNHVPMRHPGASEFVLHFAHQVGHAGFVSTFPREHQRFIPRRFGDAKIDRVD
jgi:hypothetical protein